MWKAVWVEFGLFGCDFLKGWNDSGPLALIWYAGWVRRSWADCNERSNVHKGHIASVIPIEGPVQY